MESYRQYMQKQADIEWDTPTLKILSLLMHPSNIFSKSTWSRPTPRPLQKPYFTVPGKTEDTPADELYTNAMLFGASPEEWKRIDAIDRRQQAEARKDKVLKREADKLWDMVKPPAPVDPAKAAAEAKRQEAFAKLDRDVAKMRADVAAMVKRNEEQKLLASARMSQPATTETSANPRNQQAYVESVGTWTPMPFFESKFGGKLTPVQAALLKVPLRKAVHGGKNGVRTSNDIPWAARNRLRKGAAVEIPDTHPGSILSWLPWTYPSKREQQRMLDDSASSLALKRYDQWRQEQGYEPAYRVDPRAYSHWSPFGTFGWGSPDQVLAADASYKRRAAAERKAHGGSGSLFTDPVKAYAWRNRRGPLSAEQKMDLATLHAGMDIGDAFRNMQGRATPMDSGKPVRQSANVFLDSTNYRQPMHNNNA